MMAYTEVKEKNGKRYYYRVISVRDGGKVGKERKYLGKDLKKKDLKDMEREADRELGVLSALLSMEELEELETIRHKFSKLPKATYDNRYEAFVSNFTSDLSFLPSAFITMSSKDL